MAEESGLTRQIAIYGSPSVPPVHLGAPDWLAAAEQCLDAKAAGYLLGNAGAEDTAAANRDAFACWRIRPRVLRDVSRRDWSCRIGDCPLTWPVLLAPVGAQGILHPAGERATAEAAAAADTPFILSTVSSATLEDVAALLPARLRWFQLYCGRDWEVMASLVARAERQDYQALVVTVDTPMLGWRPRDLQNAYLPFLEGQGLANYWTDPAFRAKLGGDPAEQPERAVELFLATFVNPAFTWHDLTRLVHLTRLPVLVKGLTHPDDARDAVRAGARGIVVSTHGGRQLDGAVPALQALPAVVAAVGDRVPVLFDSGIRHGADVVKALALGARAVLWGRPYAAALAVAGAAGVQQSLLDLRAEMDLTLAMAGVTRLDEVGPAMLAPA